jgi:cell division protease FtsH
MERSHARDYSEEIASAIDDEVRRLIESAHDEAWEVLVEYRDVLDSLVLRLLDKETLSRKEVLEVFATVQKRPLRGSYTGYGKRLPSDRPPVLTPKELALAATSDKNGMAVQGNGQAVGYVPDSGNGDLGSVPGGSAGGSGSTGQIPGEIYGHEEPRDSGGNDGA